jgi:hypothetical protein
MFLHTIRGSLIRQPMKYQIITCESVVVGIRDDTVLGKRLRGRSGGPPVTLFPRKPQSGGPPLLPTFCPKARVIPKKENPSLRGFDD